MLSRSRRPSAQTMKVLETLAADSSAWRYGYELGLEVGLRSGSLYPILVRLCDRGLLEAKWEEGPPAGRPPRHLYRGPGSLALAHVVGWVKLEFLGIWRWDHLGGSGGRTLGPRLLVLALVVLVATFAVPAIVCVLRIRGADNDVARFLLTLAVQGLPADRADWAQAMLVEFDRVEGRRERWQFSLGCACASVRVTSREPGGALLRALVLGCTAIALALVGYGLVHYPGLRSEPNVWGAMIVFLATLLAYAALTVFLSRGEGQRSVAAHAHHEHRGHIAG